MSLLGNPVYANPSTPLWVSVAGDTIDGNLTVTGTLEANGPTILDGTVDVRNGASGVNFRNTTGTSLGLKVSTDALGTNAYLETNGTLYLGRAGAGVTANTSFVPSAPTTNGDVLTVGGQILSAAGKGITPTVSTTATTSIPVGVPTSLAPTPAIAITSGQTYDIQVSGYFTIPLGTTPAPLDKMELIVSVGPGTAPGFYANSIVTDFYPGWAEDPWTAGSFRPFSIRARLPANANLANIVVLATLTATGVYLPTGIDADITQVSVVRVA